MKVAPHIVRTHLAGKVQLHGLDANILWALHGYGSVTGCAEVVVLWKAACDTD